MESQIGLVIMEYLALVSSGVAGALAAVHKKYDIFSVLIVGWVTALGGGILRDLLLGATPPVGVSDKGMILTAALSGVAALVFHPEIADLRRSMLVSDALALGLFAVQGTLKGLDYRSSAVTAVFLGMATALGGGLIRDVLLNVEPTILRDQHFYALPSFIGCLLTVGVRRLVGWGQLPHSLELPLDLVIIVVIVVLRLLSVKFNILIPGAVERHQSAVTELQNRAHKAARTRQTRFRRPRPR